MARHELLTFGAWGSKAASIVARQCRKCGLTFFEINYTADSSPNLLLGHDGAELQESPFGSECK